MEKNKNHTQRKKDGEALAVSHLETRSSMEEENTSKCKTKDVDNHAEIIKDPTDNWLELYTKFKNKCWRHGITDKEEIVLLYDIL